MNLDFSGQTVLITGATRGIGAATAAAFEAAGASLLLTGTDRERIEEANHRNERAGRGRVHWLHADFSSATTTAAFLEALALAPPLQVLVNNAGANRINAIDAVGPEELDLLLSINLRAPLLICAAVGRGMKERGYGRIVNIASIWSVVTRPGRVVYSSTKSGLAGMTRAVAVDLAPHGVLVNALSPGFVATELTDATLAADEQERLARQVPLGRFAAPEEIARAVLFLASPQNSYLTGQNVVIDGGFACL